MHGMETPWWAGKIDIQDLELRELGELYLAIALRMRSALDLRRVSILDSYKPGDIILFEWHCLFVDGLVLGVTRRRLRVRIIGLDEFCYVDPLCVKKKRARVDPGPPFPERLS